MIRVISNSNNNYSKQLRAEIWIQHITLLTTRDFSLG